MGEPRSLRFSHTRAQGGVTTPVIVALLWGLVPGPRVAGGNALLERSYGTAVERLRLGTLGDSHLALP